MAKRSAGALDAALSLLGAVTAGPPDALRAAEVERLRGSIAFDQGRAREAARTLLERRQATRRHDPGRARVAYLEAMSAAIWASGPDAPGILAYAAAEAPPPVASAPPADVLLQALALRFTRGYPAAAPHLTKALDQAREAQIDAENIGDWLWLAGNRASGIIAVEVWDFDAAHELALRQDRMARETGALVQLQFALNFRANLLCLTGDLQAVGYLVEEDRDLASATGNPAVGYARLLLEAYRGDETTATALIDATAREATARSQGRMAAFATYANSVLHNGLGRYDAARDAALQVFEQDVLGYGVLVVGELAEAASRTGDTKLVETALAWLTERTTATPTDWGRGIEARARRSWPPTRPPTATRSSTSAEHHSASRSPEPTSCTANGYGARDVAWTPANSCARPTNSSPRWDSGPSPSGPATNCSPPARRFASADRTHSTT